jgi:hypothetical protein
MNFLHAALGAVILAMLLSAGPVWADTPGSTWWAETHHFWSKSKCEPARWSPAHYVSLGGVILKDDGVQVVVLINDPYAEYYTYFRTKEACERWTAQYR